MQKYSLYLLLFCLVSFTSCEDFFSTTVHVDLPEVDEILVVNSVAKVGEPISIDLSRTQGILEEGETYQEEVDNGTVSLYKSGNLLEQISVVTSRIDSSLSNIYMDENGQLVLEFDYDTIPIVAYNSSIIAEAGATYEVRATAPGFEEVRVMTTMPNIASIKSAVITDTIVRNVPSYGESKFINIIIELEDNPNEENYYFLDILQKTVFIYRDFEGISYRDYCFTSIDPVFIQETTEVIELEGSEPSFCNGATLLADRTFNGQVKRLKISVEYDPQWSFAPNENSRIELVASLGSASKDFFRYKKSTVQQSWVYENPFAEPVQVYSNTDNGLGIFAGYAIHATIVE